MTTTSFAVLTAIGPDRVGIVDDLAGLVAARGGNLEESKMAILGGEFAAIMLVHLEPAQLEALASSLPGLEKTLGLRLELRKTRAPEPQRGGRPYVLESVSLDTPGIVHSITAILKAHGVNIEELETLTQPAPWTGAPMFHMRARIILGPQIVAAQLKAEFARLEAEKDLDISLKPTLATPPE